MLHLYKIEQDKNNDYDTYDSAVVAAESEEEARKIHPGTDHAYISLNDDSWVATEDVKVTWLGVAGNDVMPGVIVSSFNAG